MSLLWSIRTPKLHLSYSLSVINFFKRLQKQVNALCCPPASEFSLHCTALSSRTTPPLYNCILHHFGMRNAALALCGNLPPMDKSDLQMKHFHLCRPMAFNTVRPGYEWIQSVSYLYLGMPKRKEGEVWDTGRRESHVTGTHMCIQGMKIIYCSN